MEAGSGCVWESGELLTWGLRVRGGRTAEISRLIRTNSSGGRAGGEFFLFLFF